MAEPASATDLQPPRRHILGMEGVPKEEIEILLDLSESYIDQNRQDDKKLNSPRRTLINVFFENSTPNTDIIRTRRKTLGRRRNKHVSFLQRD